MAGLALLPGLNILRNADCFALTDFLTDNSWLFNPLTVRRDFKRL
jgi:hypothetical protein